MQDTAFILQSALSADIMNGQNIIIDKLQGTFLMTVPLAAVKDTLTIPLMASCF